MSVISLVNKKINTFLKDKTIMVTGGTGSFGSTIVKSLLERPVKKVIIFSRDEFKQYNLKNQINNFGAKAHFIIGDVRNLNSVIEATRGVDIIFHAAAMKHVPICERNPMEAVQTNVMGAYNVREGAITNNVRHVISISTDKAVQSVNVMGMTKAIQERLLLANNRNFTTQFVCVRFGNVIASNGSAVSFFKECIELRKTIPLTDERMTRFFMTLEDSLDLVFKAMIEGRHGEIFVKKMPVARVVDIIKVMAKKMTGSATYPTQIIGLREGEQLYESLVSEEESARVTNFQNHYIIYPYEKKKKIQNFISEAYRSDLIKKYMTLVEIEDQLKRACIL